MGISFQVILLMLSFFAMFNIVVNVGRKDFGTKKLDGRGYLDSTSGCFAYTSSYDSTSSNTFLVYRTTTTMFITNKTIFDPWQKIWRLASLQQNAHMKNWKSKI